MALKKSKTKTTAKKKAPPKKKTTAKAKAKPAVKKKAAPKAKAKSAVKKKAVPKAKSAVKKKAVPKAKPAVKKKAAAKKTVATKKAAPKKKPTPAKKTASAKTTRSKGKVTTASTPIGGLKPYTSKKGEDYMNDAQREHFRKILLAWKTELMEEVDRTVDHMKNEAANFADPADRATQEEEFSLELRTRDRERKLIKKIDESLMNLDADEYGYCEACGIEIGVRRLEARPTATLCIDCKTLEEIKEKQLSA